MRYLIKLISFVLIFQVSGIDYIHIQFGGFWTTLLTVELLTGGSSDGLLDGLSLAFDFSTAGSLGSLNNSSVHARSNGIGEIRRIMSSLAMIFLISAPVGR